MQELILMAAKHAPYDFLIKMIKDVLLEIEKDGLTAKNKHTLGGLCMLFITKDLVDGEDVFALINKFKKEDQILSHFNQKQ
jgi:hypothetical protein